MTYLGYENLETGVYSLIQTNIDLKEYSDFVKNNVWEKYNTPDMVSDLINLMETKQGSKDKDTVLFLLAIMVKLYIESGVEFGNENFYWFRTNGKRCHTIGRKLWKGAKRQEVEKFFKKNLKKDYDYVYQNW